MTFATENKPMPGRPVSMAQSANDLKHNARLLAESRGMKFEVRKLSKLQARVVIGACRSNVQAIQDGKTLVIHMGGAR